LIEPIIPLPISVYLSLTSIMAMVLSCMVKRYFGSDVSASNVELNIDTSSAVSGVDPQPGCQRRPVDIICSLEAALI